MEHLMVYVEPGSLTVLAQGGRSWKRALATQDDATQDDVEVAKASRKAVEQVREWQFKCHCVECKAKAEEEKKLKEEKKMNESEEEKKLKEEKKMNAPTSDEASDAAAFAEGAAAAKAWKASPEGQSFMTMLPPLMRQVRGSLLPKVIPMGDVTPQKQMDSMEKMDSSEKVAKMDSSEKEAKIDSSEKVANTDSSEKVAKIDSSEKVANMDSSDAWSQEARDVSIDQYWEQEEEEEELDSSEDEELQNRYEV